MDDVIAKLNNLTALYIRREKENTPPYSIAGEKFIDMKKRNLLLRLCGWHNQINPNKEVSHEPNRA